MTDKKILIKEFDIKRFSEIHSMIKDIENTQIIALISLKKLIKNQSELRRIIKILKERSIATKGDIAILGDWIVLTPRFVEIDRGPK